MKEILYLEVPTTDSGAVRDWLQTDFVPGNGEKLLTPDGLRLRNPVASVKGLLATELSIFVWSVQRTTYLKVFRWGDKPFTNEGSILQRLTTGIRSRFPHQYPEPPKIDPQKSIFSELEPYYPLTVRYFQKMPHGEYDLKRAYWWEQRWREGVRNPQQPRQVVFYAENQQQTAENTYDLIYIGGALGAIHAAVMAKLGYKVLLVERLSFGRMNREWNISRDEIQTLVNLGLLTNAELETI
ncbi:MAG: flavin-dependent dehydrogenase, partial [Sphaerospermopsis sp.]|nr:flavin-dependent dehydrogenase [Sphaerospermopsis sp.]